MIEFDPRNDRQVAAFTQAMNEARREIENAWAAFIHWTGCVECSRRDITQTVAALAEKTATVDIIGLDFLNEWAGRQGSHDELPIERNGTRRHCNLCHKEGQGA
jgi:hypothetical protein